LQVEGQLVAVHELQPEAPVEGVNLPLLEKPHTDIFFKRFVL